MTGTETEDRGCPEGLLANCEIKKYEIFSFNRIDYKQRGDAVNTSAVVSCLRWTMR